MLKTKISTHKINIHLPCRLQCSVSCGTGRRDRKVACLSAGNDVNNCDQSTRPPTTMSCQQPSCDEEDDVTPTFVVVKKPKLGGGSKKPVKVDKKKKKKSKSIWKRGHWSKVGVKKRFFDFN